MKKNIFLIFALAFSTTAYSAQQSSYSDIIKGNLQIIPALWAFKTIEELQSNEFDMHMYQATDLLTTYRFAGVKPASPLARVCYSSQECEDWNCHIHPKLQYVELRNLLRADHLPLLEPIARKGSDERVALVDLQEGDTIALTIPLYRNPTVVQLTCTGYRGMRFEEAVAAVAVKRIIPDELRKIMEGRLAAHKERYARLEAESKKNAEQNAKPESKDDKKS